MWRVGIGSAAPVGWETAGREREKEEAAAVSSFSSPVPQNVSAIALVPVGLCLHVQQ